MTVPSMKRAGTWAFGGFGASVASVGASGDRS
jgi:hypothetical protein